MSYSKRDITLKYSYIKCLYKNFRYWQTFKIIIILWGVSHSRQHSRCYITAEDKAALKIRHKARNSQNVEELKVGDSERKRDRRSQGGTDIKEGKNWLWDTK